jgi:hypothetical protein
LDLASAEALAKELVAKLSVIEERLMAQARLAKQVASS